MQQSPYRLAIGNEFNAQRAWLGEVYLMAIYSTELTAAEVSQNFAAGADAKG